MSNIKVDKLIAENKLIFYGDMGIKQVYYNDDLIYNRSGAYFYLEFKNEEDK